MKKDIVIGCADPRGAAMYNLFAHGEAKATEGGSITEGIGLGRVTPIIEDIKVEKAYLIPDEEAVPIIFDLLEHEGLCLGGSIGINIAGAVRLAKDLGPGKTIVTVLCRLRHALSVEAVQSGLPAREELPVRPGSTRKSTVKPPFVSTLVIPAERQRGPESITTRYRWTRRTVTSFVFTDSGLAPSACPGMTWRELSMPTDCLFREDAYLTSTRRDRPRRSPRRAASCSTAPASTRPPAGSRATAACW